MKVLRYEVPVDDDWHDFELHPASDILHVESRKAEAVELWILDRPWPGPKVTRSFRVFGTGHDVPPLAEYRGTAIPLDFPMVAWHLFEVAPAEVGRG